MNQYIVKDEKVCGGRACIQGRRIRVQDIACYSEWWGWTPDRIASELELTLAQVHTALAYYFDHLDEIREEIKAELSTYQKGKESAPSKLSLKLGQLGIEDSSQSQSA